MMRWTNAFKECKKVDFRYDNTNNTNDHDMTKDIEPSCAIFWKPESNISENRDSCALVTMDISHVPATINDGNDGKQPSRRVMYQKDSPLRDSKMSIRQDYKNIEKRIKEANHDHKEILKYLREEGINLGKTVFDQSYVSYVWIYLNPYSHNKQSWGSLLPHYNKWGTLYITYM